MSNLVSPDSITEAVDSTDLLNQLLELNEDKVDNKLRRRVARDLRGKRDAEIYDLYINKAEEYYLTLWIKCANSLVGHSLNNLDIKGYSIPVCDTCGCPPLPAETHHAFNRTDNYRNDLFRNLAKQLRKLDEEAGVIDIPTEEDFMDAYDGVSNGSTPKRTIWSFWG